MSTEVLSADLPRITPEEVVCANFALGLRPTQGYGDGETCGCPQTILALARGITGPYLGSKVEQWADKQYGADYAEQFRTSFDYPRDPIVAPPGTRAYIGVQDGRACRAALLPVTQD